LVYYWFLDVECCFHLSIIENKNYKTGWTVKVSFDIGLHIKDKVLLELIQSYFGVGKLYVTSLESICFRVKSVKEIAVLINHFDKYPLITKKFADYLLFKQWWYELIKNK